MKKGLIVYAIRNKKNNKVYIGSTSGSKDRRWNQHLCMLRAKKHSYLFQNDWDSSLEDDWQFIVLEENIEYRLLGMVESYWIQQYKSNDPNYGYNKKYNYTREWISRRNKKMLSISMEMIEDLKSGMTYRDIASKYGVSAGTVWDVRKKHLPYLDIKHHILSDSDEEKVVKMIAEGSKVFEIATKFKVSESVIFSIKKRRCPESIRKGVNDEIKNKIVELRKNGFKYRQIVKEVGKSLGTICSVLNKQDL